MIVLSNIARLYDGSSAEACAVREGVDLHVDGGRIAKLTNHDPKLEGGGGLTLIDASNWTVVPGIIDCHAHVTVTGITGKHLDLATGPSGLARTEKVLYRTLVDGGVTTARDIGGATHAIKRLVEEGVFIGPRLKIAICMLSTTGGHADFRGPDRCHAGLSRLWPEAPGRPSSIVDGPWECRKRVREIAACGADLIKLCTSPGVASPSDQLEHQDFGAEEIRAICHEAEGRGLKVAAHAHSSSGIRLAIENGVHDIQHISFMDAELVELADKRGCTVTPTSWVVTTLPDAPDLSDFVREKAKRVAEVHARAVDFARRGGLKILAGTDAVLAPMHGRNWLEVAHLIDDGLSPLSAWFGATGLAAEEIGQSDTGILAAGKRADFLVCSADVIADPRRFADGGLLEVVQDGVAHRGGVPALPQRQYSDTVARVLD
jgi:imidazolonepropionase-like amidohydrolase